MVDYHLRPLRPNQHIGLYFLLEMLYLRQRRRTLLCPSLISLYDAHLRPSRNTRSLFISDEESLTFEMSDFTLSEGNNLMMRALPGKPPYITVLG